MKYRVVGWTDCDGDDAPDSESPIGFAERHAIVEDIKKNCYLFTGGITRSAVTVLPLLFS